MDQSERQPASALASAVLDICGESLDAMVAILEEFGTSAANRIPDLPGANSPYAIVFHCVGMLRFWAGSVVAGLGIQRDRDAEFTASGTVEDLIADVRLSRAQLPEWVDIALTDGIRDRSPVGSTRVAAVETATPEWVLLHISRELAQHLGQLQITMDLLGRG